MKTYTVPLYFFVVVVTCLVALYCTKFLAKNVLKTVSDSDKSKKLLPRNCEDIQRIGWGALKYSPSGVYKMYAKDEENSEFEVYCDMETANGGWLVIQRRSESDSATDFYRDWNEYAKGFGNLNGSHWLGLDRISALTNDEKYKLRVDMMDMDGNKRYAEYRVFQVSNSTDLYRLHVVDYTGDAGDSLSLHNGKPFSTKDRDNDEFDTSCAITFHGAWWYVKCHKSNLNGLYGSIAYGVGINWETWKGHTYSLKRVEMKIRTTNYKHGK